MGMSHSERLFSRRLFEKQPQQHMKPVGAPPLHPSVKECPDFFKMSFGQTLEMLRLCKGSGSGGEKSFQTPKQSVDRKFERGEIIVVPESSIPYSSGGIDAPEGYFDDMDDESLSFANSTEQEDRVDFSSTQVFLMLTLGKRLRKPVTLDQTSSYLCNELSKY